MPMKSLKTSMVGKHTDTHTHIKFENLKMRYNLKAKMHIKTKVWR